MLGLILKVIRWWVVQRILRRSTAGTLKTNTGRALVRFLGQPAQQRGKVLEVARVQRHL